MLEKLITSTWNRLVAPSNRDRETGSRLDLGFQVIDGEVQRSALTCRIPKRCEHLAILGKTGQGKSFFLRHLSSQDVRNRRGFVFFDLHGDTMPFLLRLVAAEERRTRTDLSERLIVIEPADAEFSIGLECAGSAGRPAELRPTRRVRPDPQRPGGISIPSAHEPKNCCATRCTCWPTTT